MRWLDVNVRSELVKRKQFDAIFEFDNIYEAKNVLCIFDKWKNKPCQYGPFSISFASRSGT